MSKERTLYEPANWQLIAVLPIVYEVFPKIVYNRISSQLFGRQSFDKYGCTSGMRIVDARLCAELFTNIHLEFHMSLWILSMDMRKAVETIDHRALVEALRSRHLPEEHVALVSLLHTNQNANVNHSSEFPVQ